MVTTRTNSKKKGSKWERDVCKFMKEWTGYEFSRTPASGGLRWHKKDDIVSDVICTDEKHGHRLPGAIECKFYKDLKFEHILLGNDSCKILEFWEQANRDADRAKKLPLLIMRYNNMPKMEAFLMLDKEVANSILTDPELGPKLKKPRMAFQRGVDNISDTFYVFMLSDMKNLDYSKVYKHWRAILKSRYPKN